MDNEDGAGDEIDDADITTEEVVEPDTSNDRADDDHDEAEGASSAARSDSAKTDNRWKGLGDRMSEKFRSRSSAAAADNEDDDEADSPTGDDDESNRAGKPGEDSEKPKGAGEQADKKNAKPAAAPRYAITDKEGDTFVLDMPDGAKISFVADGKKVELENVDDLISLAQKGAAFDRVSSTAGQDRAKANARIIELEDGSKADEELLLKLVFDELDQEELDELREKLDKYRDPEVRKGVEALNREEKRTAAEKVARESDKVEAVKEFWQKTDTAITKDLGDFEYLDAEDATEIKKEFHREFDTRFRELAAAYVKVAPQAGATKEEALAEAEHDAAQEKLTPEALRSVMEKLNGKFSKRATKVRGKDERKGKAEADQHNRRIEGKREQSRSPVNRSLRSGGSAPAPRDTSRSEKSEPKTFEGKIGRAWDRMRTIGKDDDE